ncbi:uncharacterized protein RJT20DRAFT_135393 [Scheffersomyces xylosifermentans]|uniref:uncharacterized protein n=1 Tax=Scheffersomyces xylosifermentans TaxID=1304137 RepID=UPI00315CACA9
MLKHLAVLLILGIASAEPKQDSGETYQVPTIKDINDISEWKPINKTIVDGYGILAELYDSQNSSLTFNIDPASGYVLFKQAVVGEAVTEPEEELAVEAPDVEEPVVEEPVIEEPAIEEPVVEDTVIEEPVIEEPVIKDPIIEDPLIEEPVTEEAVEDITIGDDVNEKELSDEDADTTTPNTKLRLKHRVRQYLAGLASSTLAKRYKTCGDLESEKDGFHYRVTSCTSKKFCVSKVNKLTLQSGLSKAIANTSKSERGSLVVSYSKSWHSCVEYYSESSSEKSFEGCPVNWCEKDA